MKDKNMRIMLALSIIIYSAACATDKASEFVVGENGNTELHAAVFNGDVGKVRDLIPLSEIDARNDRGSTPLWVAVRYGDEEIVKALFEVGANACLPGNDDTTPLHWAAAWDNLNMIRLLVSSLKAQAQNEKINAQDSAGATPLLVALACESEVAACALLGVGVDPNLAGGNGITPLQVAIKKDLREASAKLLKKGATPYSQSHRKIDMEFWNEEMLSRLWRARRLSLKLNELVPS